MKQKTESATPVRRPTKLELAETMAAVAKSRASQLQEEVDNLRKAKSERELAMKEVLVRSFSQMVESLARMIGGPGY